MLDEEGRFGGTVGERTDLWVRYDYPISEYLMFLLQNTVCCRASALATVEQRNPISTSCIFPCCDQPS